MVAFDLALLLSLNKRQRHDLYLIASALVRRNPGEIRLTRWSESSLKCSTASKASFQKKTLEKRALKSESQSWDIVIAFSIAERASARGGKERRCR